MPTTTGKKLRYIEISALGTSPVTPTAPRPTTTIGAMARIGTVWLAMIHGISERSERVVVDDHHREPDAEQRAEHEARAASPTA